MDVGFDGEGEPDEGGEIGFMFKQEVGFDSALAVFVFGPREEFETERDGGGVEGVERILEAEAFGAAEHFSILEIVEGGEEELFKEFGASIAVGIGEGGSGNQGEMRGYLRPFILQGDDISDAPSGIACHDFTHPSPVERDCRNVLGKGIDDNLHHCIACLELGFDGLRGIDFFRSSPILWRRRLYHRFLESQFQVATDLYHSLGHLVWSIVLYPFALACCEVTGCLLCYRYFNFTVATWTVY